MAVFKDCTVLLELKTLPFKEKKKLKSAITENGGNVSYVVNKQCSFIVATDVTSLSSNRLRSIQKYQTPVVGLHYVNSCIKNGAVLPLDDYKLDTSSSTSPSSFSLRTPEPDLIPCQVLGKEKKQMELCHFNKVPKKTTDPGAPPPWHEGILKKYRLYSESHSDLPSYPNHFQVAKFKTFKKINDYVWYVLELQSCRGQKEQRYRVVQFRKDKHSAKGVMDVLVFPPTAEEALEVFKALEVTLLSSGHREMSYELVDAPSLGSFQLQQLLLDEKLSTMNLSETVAMFVELVWTECLGYLDNVLQVSVDKLSLNDVTRAEGLLLQVQKMLRDKKHVGMRELYLEFHSLLPHKQRTSLDMKSISQKLDLCQLIRDILNVTEMTLGSPTPSSLGKYRALRCCIEAVPPESSEFHTVIALLGDSSLQIQQVLKVARVLELQTFKSDLGNIKPLLHSSSPSNFVGILSRGLLLPHIGVEHHGIERTDVGNLGSGIYFSNAVSTCLKYSKPSTTDGSRLLLVCDVALGKCKKVQKKDVTLTKAPEGHDSVHGVRCSGDNDSEFEDDEFVVYSPDQVKLKYVVQFTVEDDQLKEFSPAVNTTQEPVSMTETQTDMSLTTDDEFIENTLEDVTPGLLDSAGQQLPLQAVHVKCKLMDLVSQVIIFQKYTNTSTTPIEAKYVFPLDDLAAVCGFEAFINGKHVVGQVKEKLQARKEYKEAVEKGHGGYLMDQDAANVFTISVGNLPPNSTVLIKVTFVSELIIKDGGILFTLPGSVAPWQERSALNQTTQVTVEKVSVTGEAASSREFSLDMSVEMPNAIKTLESTTHQIKMKLTDCKAVVSVLPGQVIGTEGFQLFVSLSVVHLPRMWVEQHPDKNNQACMLVFYPDFDTGFNSEDNEIVLLVDNSESMKGEPASVARRIGHLVLKTLGKNHKVRINIIVFGTAYMETFEMAQPLGEVYQIVENAIKTPSSIGGSTELWRPLRTLSLLPPSRGIRNLLLLSDGHIQNPELILQLVRDNVQHSRLFTCGVSPTANQHMLRALAQAGGGAYEFFDTKMKHKWADKVAFQVKRMASPGCTSVSVKWQQFNPIAPPAIQAPKQLHALFNNCHTLVYGFVPHCTQATLHGNLSGQELKTMVSTTELQKTKGTFLHKLTARALIRDYEDGSLDTNEAKHEGKKAELKSFVIQLSEEFSILSQFTSFVAIEERDSEQPEGFTDISKLVAEEDVDLLPYMSWVFPEEQRESHVDELLTSFSSVDDDEEEEEEEFCGNTIQGDIYDMIEYSSVCQSLDYDPPPPLPPPSPPTTTVLAEVPLAKFGIPPPPPPPYRPKRFFQISGSMLPPCPPPPPCPPTTNVLADILENQESSLPRFRPPPPSFDLCSSEVGSELYGALPISLHERPCMNSIPHKLAGSSSVGPSSASSFHRKAFSSFGLKTQELEHTTSSDHRRHKAFKRTLVNKCSISPDLQQDSASEVMENRAWSAVEIKRFYTRGRRNRAAAVVNWTQIFLIQHIEGYWELTPQLGNLINVNVDVFANVFLKGKGICSLGMKAHTDILRLVATLLVLQLMRIEKLEEGKLLRSLFCLDSIQHRPPRWEALQKAVEWVCWADRQYPSIYSRLEFGLSWESSTRQLLGYDSLPTFSHLHGMNVVRPNLCCS
ncbi:poly [ADP-ribose] polymerase 4 isoform X1 [Cynoglossus semilaevis]|uniref:Poly [ADP-ribose] polymerase n=1 Tax=Cynoglossus semilaevis TaxID=244447 RepID=A0A3P8UZ93_CYNSE|nr:poly [ADP-ribose] polymerase 4 isoform X1 [Cynoglossus semilaevis]